MMLIWKFSTFSGHRNWLQSERKILDHDFPKKNGVLILFFSVKFFIENIAFTKDRFAVEQFYLQTRSLIYQVAIFFSTQYKCIFFDSLTFNFNPRLIPLRVSAWKKTSKVGRYLRVQHIFSRPFFRILLKKYKFILTKVIEF